MTAVNVFAEFEAETWPFQYKATFHTELVMGGVPSDPNIAMSWLKSKLKDTDERELDKMVAEYMVSRGLSQEKALEEINEHKHLNGFTSDPLKGLYLGGYQLKAALKEAVSVAAAAPAPPGGKKKLELRGYGDTKKYITNYFPEHVFVEELRLYLRHAKTGKPFFEPTGVKQSFPKNQRTGQTGIQYTEYCEDAEFDATITTDHPFTFKEYAVILGTGSKNGIGAQRSQGYGTYTVVKWDQVRGPEVKRSVQGKISPKADAEEITDGDDG